MGGEDRPGAAARRTCPRPAGLGAKTPSDYIAARAEDANATEAQVRHRLESHLVPYDSLIAGDFPGFLEQRAKLVHGPMQKLCDGLVP